ncbi:phospholipase D-like domain-containing protein [Lachnospira multipara]|uniref:PLD-like domain-containing protein n=1 Tax=Lachnospira multipara TaxID=28051 RepID=A0A1H5S5J8_9FIRM|nr:phospholipase D-like domain-containing protein [Lachnospira multipara]SEF45041.1 PLD-like domain-containing protein [Lachnospira multipara]
MAILFSNEIINAVIEELKSAEKSVQIITAYCKKSTFEKLNSVIAESVHNRKLLVRFRLEDVIKGSTDFDILEYGIEQGWKVYLRFDLHAKTYIVDNKRGLVGSANATNSGLNIGKAGNMEMATFVDIESADVDKINSLFHDAVFVDYELLNEMKQELEAIDLSDKQSSYNWSIDITKRFNPCIKALFSYELPDDFTFVEGEYFSFLDYTYSGDKEAFKEVFRWSNAYLWLLKLIKENNGEMYFGAVTEKLHNALITDPKPYRRDVKQMLANLLKLIDLLEMDEIVVDRPNHSQRIRIKN